MHKCFNQIGFSFVGPNKSHRKYCPVKEDLLKRDVKNFTFLFSTKASGFVLSHGLGFAYHLTNVKKEVFAEFEVLMGPLFHHSCTSKHCLSAFKVKVNHLAHVLCGTQMDLTDFTMHRKCFDAIKLLRSNAEIIIIKRDKDSGVVILNKSD